MSNQGQAGSAVIRRPDSGGRIVGRGAAEEAEILQLTREIHILEAHATERATAAIEFKIEIGRRLTRAKQILPHGAFVPWTLQHFGWTRAHVQRHISLARNVTRVGHLPPEASLRAALAAISGPRGEVEAKAATPHYVLILALLDGPVEIPLRGNVGLELMGRDLEGAEVKVVVRGQQEAG